MSKSSNRKPPPAHPVAKVARVVTAADTAPVAGTAGLPPEAAPGGPGGGPAGGPPGGASRPSASTNRSAEDVIWSAGVLLPLLRCKHGSIFKRSTATAARQM